MSNTMTVSDIIKETDALLQQKTASFKEKQAAIAGGDASDYPGAECDKPVPAEAGSANPEVKQDLPPNGTTAAGAKDAEEVEAGHTTDSTQPSGESVAKKPMETADANAKCASDNQADLANSLLSRIRDHQEKEAAAKVEEPKAEEPKAEEPKAEKEAEEAPADTSKEAEEAPAEIELTTDVLAKIASVILATEEGIEFTEGALTKAAGAEAAAETIEFLHKQAAYDQGGADAEAMIYELAQMKQAEALQAQQAEYSEEDLTKAGQALADEILAAEGGEGDLGTGEAGADVAGDIAAGGDDMEFTPEELEQALAIMVEQGQLDEATAAAIMESVGGGAAPVEEEIMPEEAMPEEAMPEEAMEVAASDESLESKILDAVKQVQASK